MITRTDDDPCLFPDACNCSSCRLIDDAVYTTQGASKVSLALWMGRYAALTRLIRKLGDSIDDVTMDALQSAQKHAKQLAGL